MAAPSVEELAELFKAFDPDGSEVLMVEGLLSVMRTQCVVPSGQRSLPAHPLPASPLQRCADWPRLPGRLPPTPLQRAGALTPARRDVHTHAA